MSRLITSAFHEDSPFEQVLAADVPSGAPATSTRALWSQSGTVETGVWVMTPGTVRDTEAQEIFVVLAGRATLTVGDDAPRTITTGDIVSFREGDRTIWHVHETLRKFYAIRTSTDME